MKQVLVVVDMQVDFVTGSLGTKQAQDIIVDSCRFIQPVSYTHLTLPTICSV